MLMEFDGVQYTYPCTQQATIQNLTLKIPQGRCCALIGRNGCGKTTLFRLANGLYRPQKGMVRWQGKPLAYDRTSLNQLRQEVGLVFQDPEQQLVGTTVEEDLSYGLCNLGLSDSEVGDRVRQGLLDFDLMNLADSPVNYLSLGQKKRVSIADVMVLQPKLLLLDEPTAYLDPPQTRNLLTTLQKIRATGATIVIATHDLDFVYAWADWILVMDRGQLILEGTPETVFSQRQIFEELEFSLPRAIEFMELVNDLFSDNTNNGSCPVSKQVIQQRIREQFRA